MQEPSKYDLHDVQDFFASTEGGPFPLLGLDGGIWGWWHRRHQHAPDLVVLKGRPKADRFSSWVMQKAITVFFRFNCHRFRKPSPVHGLVGYEDKEIFRLTLIPTGVFASLLPVGSIVALHYVKSIVCRFALIAVSNLLLSLCVMLFTTARRSELFAVTIA